MNTDQNQLNPEQEKAVTHGDGPLLIVAGAGTGKTTVISRRIAHLIMEGKCRPEEILALTFTDKAAGEMEERVDKLLPYGYVDLWIQTFHAFAQAVLEHHGLDMGLPIGFKLLNPTQQWLLVRKNLDRFKLDYYRPLGNPTKFIHALLKHFSRAKDETISAQDYLNYVESLKLNQDNADFVKGLIDDESLEKLSVSERKEVLSQEILKQTEVAEAYHTYQQLLLENNALDFGDLISYTLELFKTRKNVLAHYRAQFKYIMVDEFQDTNLAQYELLKLLASPNNNITVVGDDDQSIYKFRGASISNILQFKDDFPESKEIFLNSNYRSRQNLLDLSYAFIKQNDPYRLEVKLQNEKNKKLSKKLIAKDSTVGEIEHLHGATLADEVILVVKKIIELKNSDTDIDWSDFAILVRANASADDFVYALESAGLPYVFLASKGLYAKKIVLDLLAYLKLLDNYHESTAMYRVLTWPLWQLHHQEIVNLNYWAGRKGWSLYETIRQSAMLVGLSVEIKTKTDKVMQFLDKHSQLARSGRRATEIIQAILNDTGYLKILVSTDSVANREQLNFLNQFYKKVQEFEKENNSASLKDFLALVEMELESGEEGTLSQNQEDTGPDTIKIMTIHSAKGLEFKYVFIANMVDKKFPAIAKSDPLELPVKLVRENVPEGDVHLQEERRLMYVAMTRAKQGLYFTSASDYGGARAKKLSRFLIELEDKGLKLASQAEVKKNDFEPKSKPAEKKLLAPINTKFSFTQLSSFETCPYQYRFAYILKIPLSGKPQFSFGKSMHSTLQKFFQLELSRSNNRQTDLFSQNKNEEPNPISWEEMKNIYEQSFVDDWYPDTLTKEKYLATGEKILRGFYAKYLEERPKVKELERKFVWKIKVDGEMCTVSGAIDRIDQLPDGLKIVDYKTGTAKAKLEAGDKEQLLIYQIAAQEVFGEKVQELSFYYLENNSEMSFLGKAKDLEKVQDKIVKSIEEIKRGEFPPNPGWSCDYCDFKKICEFRA